MELTAEQKIRQALTGSPHGIVQYQHEGDDIVRWLTGGTMPDAYVTLTQDGNEKIARCPLCKQELGRIDARYGTGTGERIAAIREAGHKHQRQEHAATP